MIFQDFCILLSFVSSLIPHKDENSKAVKVGTEPPVILITAWNYLLK